jgi:hypothetical protein
MAKGNFLAVKTSTAKRNLSAVKGETSQPLRV